MKLTKFIDKIRSYNVPRVKYLVPTVTTDTSIDNKKKVQTVETGKGTMYDQRTIKL